MPSNNRVRNLIISYARKYGIDPDVALRVAMSEGGVRYGAVGDGGHAFGPFQMNDAGGVLTHRRGNHAAYANSPAGIEEALRSAAPYARGKHGQAGVSAFVRGYERPANPAAEIARAMGYNIGQIGAGAPMQAPINPMGQPKVDLARYIQASNAAIAGKTPMPSIVSFITQNTPQEATGSSVAASQGHSDGTVSFAPGADRPGVHTNRAITAFVAQISGIAGRPLRVGTGTNHNQYVAGTHRQSDHWGGNAVDIPASGAQLTQLGQDALIAAGMPPAQARKQKGGLYNIHGHQIIFNSNIGGNHYNHLHVSAKGK